MTVWNIFLSQNNRNFFHIMVVFLEEYRANFRCILPSTFWGMVGSDGKEEKCVDHCEKLYVYDVRMHMLEHF